MSDLTAPAEKKSFDPAFKWLCGIEMFERLAYFGIRVMVPIYIMQATEPGGLHLTAVHKGWIYMWWAILQSWLPMFTGGIADRYGYKNVLAFSIVCNTVGYLMMAAFHSYYGFFAGILVLAFGTAFFKPSLQGSIAQNLTKANSSVGWGIFYWTVNVGGVLAPVIATIILGTPHSAEGWRNLFIASAGFTMCNLLLLFTFRDVPSGADKELNLAQVFTRTVENIWPFWLRGGRFHAVRGPLGLLMVVVGLVLFVIYEMIAEWAGLSDATLLGIDGATALQLTGGLMFLVGALLATWLEGGVFQWQLRLPAFLLIMSAFWLMMYQLWDLHPNFITDWVDSSAAAESLKGSLGIWWEYGDRGLLQVPQQILLNLNGALIVILVIPVTWAASRMRTLSAMLIGMTVATIGVVVGGMSQSGWILLLGIVFFSLGEMWTGPKKNEYLGLIAPPGKKGLYLGYVNIPVGVGVGIGSMIAGIVYDNYGEKATLSLKELGRQTQLLGPAARSVDWSDDLDELPGLMGIDRDQAFALSVDALTAQSPRAEAPESIAADTLRAYYRDDVGQVRNLALLYIVDHDRDRSANVRAGWAAALRNDADTLEKGGSDAVSADRPGRVAALRALADRVAKDAPLVESGLPRYIHGVPKWSGASPVEALEIARDLANRDRADDARLAQTQFADLLWREYGDDPHVLNNLALEYLAQGTDRLSNAVAAKVESVTIKNPVEDIPAQFAIGRTKSFDALSAAHGADAAAVEAALAEHAATVADADDRLYVFLTHQPHTRFIAVARRDWTKDVPLLESMIESSPASKEIVNQHIDDKRFPWDYTVAPIIRLLSGQGDATLYGRLAGKPELIQRALESKDWSASPDDARRLIRLSVPEARARVSTEISRAAQLTTNLLWREYHPQYKVWLPFGAIGIAATIALAIFGRMARRWADMNA